jgi:hypothetical protein
MKDAYRNEKKNVYFKVPILPKKCKLNDKADLLKMSGMESNIFHEVVRRKRWNLYTKAYARASAEATTPEENWYF